MNDVKRRWPRMRIVFYREGNCWRLLSFSRQVYWSGGLTYYKWWRLALVLDWRANWTSDLAHPERTEQYDPS